MSIEEILFYLLVIDSVGANAVAWFDGKWYTKHFKIFSRWFPVAKGWTAWYLVLVLWLGYAFYRLGIIF